MSGCVDYDDMAMDDDELCKYSALGLACVCTGTSGDRDLSKCEAAQETFLANEDNFSPYCLYCDQSRNAGPLHDKDCPLWREEE